MHSLISTTMHDRNQVQPFKPGEHLLGASACFLIFLESLLTQALLRNMHALWTGVLSARVGGEIDLGLQ